LFAFLAAAPCRVERRFSYVGSRHRQLAPAFLFGKNAWSKFLNCTDELGEEDERYFFRAHAEPAVGGIGGLKPGRVFL
jgi:hypothetical protein